MVKKKIKRFRELDSFSHVVQPSFKEVYQLDHPLKGNWNRDFFQNEHPITLELGCGKGEYTVGLAKAFPQINFIGIDIKGARMWKGAREIQQLGLQNAGFLRTRIELIESFFAPTEVNEIWITFPDPQPKKAKKRLSSPQFLNRYQRFMKPEGIIHLKTDSRELYDYSLNILRYNNCKVLWNTTDVYASPPYDQVLSIKTFYENQFLMQGKPITYIRSVIGSNPLSDVPGETT